MRVLLVGSFIALCLYGCSPSTAYRQAESEPALTVPEGMVLREQQPLYPIPEGPSAEWDQEQDDFQAPRPPQIHEPVVAEEETPEAPAPAENTRVVLARDGNGYPIIMMHTRFAWAWEYVGQALDAAGFEINDRNRESGVFYIDIPEGMRKQAKTAQLKLSHTANGIQITVLKPDGSALLDKQPGQAVLSRLYEEL